MLRTIVEVAAEVEARYDESRAKQILSNGIGVKVNNNASTMQAISKQHLNGEKLQAATGFAPDSDFRDTLRSTIEFYRDTFMTGWE
ncbi:hypothetical protein JKG47_09900 [Acidithiobacillus sp. MC6.1]|nr:hypothetical protein [Acidithiobacillus sp. MC6.1]